MTVPFTVVMSHTHSTHCLLLLYSVLDTHYTCTYMRMHCIARMYIKFICICTYVYMYMVVITGFYHLSLIPYIRYSGTNSPSGLFIRIYIHVTVSHSNLGSLISLDHYSRVRS